MIGILFYFFFIFLLLKIPSLYPLYHFGGAVIRATLVSWPCSSLNQFVPKLVRPLACSSYNYYLFTFSNHQFLTLTPSTNATPALSTLWFLAILFLLPISITKVNDVQVEFYLHIALFLWWPFLLKLTMHEISSHLSKSLSRFTHLRIL